MHPTVVVGSVFEMLTLLKDKLFFPVQITFESWFLSARYTNNPFLLNFLILERKLNPGYDCLCAYIGQPIWNVLDPFIFQPDHYHSTAHIGAFASSLMETLIKGYDYDWTMESSCIIAVALLAWLTAMLSEVGVEGADGDKHARHTNGTIVEPLQS